MTKHTMHFTISGEFLTEHFRGQVLEGNWRGAVEGLKDSLIGFTYDYAIALLKGEKKLIGNDNDIALVDDDDSADYRKELDWHFGDLYIENNLAYRAYAYVSSYGPSDVPPGRQYAPGDAPYKLRTMKYANNQTDIAKIVRLQHTQENGTFTFCQFVLFEIVPDVPSWIKQNRDFQMAAVKTRGTVRGLEERGYHITMQGYEYAETAEERAEIVYQTVTPEIPETQEDTYCYDRHAAQDLMRKDKIRERERIEHIAELRAEIIKQANGDFITHDFGGNIGSVEIPRVPLLYWALRRARFTDLPPWSTVCMSGMKMFADDATHTDWMVGAGIDLDEYHNKQFNDAAFDLMFKLQEEYMDLTYTILVAGKPNAVGTIVHPKKSDRCTDDDIAVIPNASQAWYETVKGASGVIVQQGGAMSHLAVVGLEEEFLIIRDPDAFSHYKLGMLIAIDTTKERVEVLATP